MTERPKLYFDRLPRWYRRCMRMTALEQLETDQPDRRKLYLYRTVAVARRVAKTAQKYGLDVTRIGSGCILLETDYERLRQVTYAPEAALVAVREETEA